MAEQRRLEQCRESAFCHKLQSTVAVGYEQYDEVIYLQDGLVSVVLFGAQSRTKNRDETKIHALPFVADHCLLTTSALSHAPQTFQL
jgi:hypothetical protein